MKQAVILAAGKGTRMKSKKHKVMHEILNKPMIGHLVSSLQKANVEKIVVVIGHEANQIQEYLQDSVEYVLQEKQLGTGHAVMQAAPILKDLDGETLILNGDGPLIRPETIEAIFQANKENELTVVTALLASGGNYGRIVHDHQQQIVKIVEAKDCVEKELAINEINTGIMCFKNKVLFDSISSLSNDNSQQEYYLTDMVSLLYDKGSQVRSFIAKDNDEVMGINDRYELSQAQRWLKLYINKIHMLNGVTIMDPDTTYIDEDVEIACDTVIYPGVTICKGSKIAEDVIIKSNAWIENSEIAKGASIESCKIIDSFVGEQSVVGPMSHIRNHTKIGKHCRIGNFVEFKNANFGDSSKCAHLTYLGDSDVGEDVNIGCGVVTVNYDGKHKFKTIIGDGAFIGSNCNLIAPITIGKNALLAAGSTITESVEDGEMGIARSYQVNKKNLGNKYKEK